MKTYLGLIWQETDIARMTHKVIDFYFGVDYEIVWHVVKKLLNEMSQRDGGFYKTGHPFWF
ncbi:MAG: hypothetical protein ACPL4I_00675, partial [Bacteroidota bacterium]